MLYEVITNSSQNEQLATFLSSMEDLLNEFAQEISGHYLSRVPATPHYTVVSGRRNG